MRTVTANIAGVPSASYTKWQGVHIQREGDRLGLLNNVVVHNGDGEGFRSLKSLPQRMSQKSA